MENNTPEGFFDTGLFLSGVHLSSHPALLPVHADV